MPAPIPNEDFSDKLCKRLGLGASKVRSISLTCAPDELLTARVELAVGEKQAAGIHVDLEGQEVKVEFWPAKSPTTPLLFSARLRIAKAFHKWRHTCLEKKVAADTAENVLAFLESEGLLNNDKAREFLKTAPELDGVTASPEPSPPCAVCNEENGNHKSSCPIRTAKVYSVRPCGCIIADGRQFWCLEHSPILDRLREQINLSAPIQVERKKS